MQIGKLWTAGLAIVFGVLLAACYDNNGNSTTAGGGTPSTNNIAPSGITNANFALQYTSGPLVSTIDSLQLSGNGTFTRNPTLSLTGLASSGSYSPPLLDANGNIWRTTLTTSLANGSPTNIAEILVLTFTSKVAGSFTLSGLSNAVNAGKFTASGVVAMNHKRFPSEIEPGVRPLFGSIQPIGTAKAQNHSIVDYNRN
ncbi:MAG: hypothetical protein JWM99_2768 [Verrucomicrobiales bacterium]|nr:hypothetical protein [Verrucomicrobiales bacterium]